MYSCGGDSTSNTASTDSDTANPLKAVPEQEVVTDDAEDSKLDLIMRTSANRDYTHKRPEALSILDHRISKDGEIYQIIENGMFEYDMVHNGTKMSRPGDYEGQWIDFKDDHTYTYGNNKDQQGQGRYHYSLDSGKLLMIDNDKSSNPQEWNVMRKAHVMILVGNEVYGNNNYQMKLVQRFTVDQVMDPNYVEPDGSN